MDRFNHQTASADRKFVQPTLAERIRLAVLVQLLPFLAHEAA
jgi:hypothetical protein